MKVYFLTVILSVAKNPPVKSWNSSFRFTTFRITLLTFFLFPVLSFSQTVKFKTLSCAEKWWVVKHVFVAKKARNISEEARQTSKLMKKDTLLDGDADGGQVDAFRHAYWMARLSQEMCWRKALRLGKAHEKGNYRSFKKQRYEESSIPDSAASVMDLFNNKVGVVTGCNNKHLSASELTELLRTQILSGEMRIIRKDLQGRPLDCEENPIDTAQYRGQWNVPRCIVNSNYHN